ncbi:hypothetical protein BJY01DRAFT_222383 [Aspergillus pseudoustus]|uniref:BZIP domain-containing protein n=1 Tax=Aspergillus pseudoustus TaxID=1810923 RepID=A0ABR4J7Z5_9EURO
MDRDVVEGNFTSSARFPDPEPLALMDPSHTHMNDLGLTPSPGFQLQGHILQDDGQDLSGSYNGLKQTSSGKAGDGQSAVEPQTNKELNLNWLDTEANGTNATEDFYDRLFDSTVSELDSLFSRKRNAEEPQEFPPEKRQHLESPDETPSLTTDTTNESPASFFDAFDSLFGNGYDLPLISPDEPLPDFEEPTPPPSDSGRVSDTTRERFSLDETDIITATAREIFKVQKEPEYASPYPVSGGPLGYLPSAPGIHVKCVAVGESLKENQILSLRAKVSQLTRERDHFKKSLLQYATMDSSGKTPEQLLREENAMLRRVSSRHQARVEEYKKEAAEWKNKLHLLGTIHNNLLYEIGVEKRIPSIVPFPEGYHPPRIPKAMQNQIGGYVYLHHGHSGSPPPHAQAPVQPVPLDIDPTSPRPIPHAQGVTIDLTEDETPPTPAPSTGEPERPVATLQSLRSKKYDWLQPGNDNTSMSTPCHSPRIADDELALLMEEELSRA